jgi:TRAP-type mannitol/chloroaromatic compound transport system permease small subunit
VQSLEYAITTPILSAALLASFSPTVPTGVVQLLYILMLASQLLCIPVLYLSNLYKRMEKDYAPYTHPNCLRMGVLLLLGACYTLQINAITVKCIFFRQLWDAQYNVDSFLMSTTILMIVVQGFFLLAVFAQSLANITSKGEGSWKATTISRYSLRTYMVLNFLLKFVVGILAFYTARNKAFPAYACGLWANV